MTLNHFPRIAILLASMSLAACGGGGGGGGGTTNADPNADAGTDQIVNELTNVVLDATDSSDSDGSITSYQWTRISGPVVSLTNANTIKANFTAPDVAVQTAMTFRLTVTDNGGATDTADTNITVNPVVANVPPVANAGPNQNVDEGDTVNLNGSASSDSDGTVNGYLWSQVSDGAPTVTINNANAVNADFTAPTVAEDKVLTFQLVVTDDDSASSNPDYIQINVKNITGGTYSISGTITPTGDSQVDSDVNDTNTTPVSNNTLGNVQDIPNPAVTGGYVNLAGTGATGNSRTSGDDPDLFRANLLAGQSINLNIADKSVADLDLFLWNSSMTTVIDYSYSYDSDESVTVPANGEYIIEVDAWSGYSNYNLSSGLSAAIASNGYRLSDEFVAGDIIVGQQKQLQGVQQPVSKQAMTNLGLVRIRGNNEGPMLYRINTAAQSPFIQSLAQTGEFDRRLKAMNAEQRQRFETLTTIKELARGDGISYIQPNYIVKPLATPNDTHYGLQWHYPLINLPSAWDVTQDNYSARVAVIDTGSLPAHPDMIGQFDQVDGYDFISSLAISGDGDGIDGDPTDVGDGGSGRSSFHGTHVAGTIAANSNNSTGVAGVAWTTSTEIVPIRVLGEGGGTSYDVLQGVYYAAGLANDSGGTIPAVDVINLSLGGSGSCGGADQAAYTAARAAGVVTVVAAGNSASDAANFSPANCDDVLTVSAVDYNSNLAPYSNYGSVVELAAPGGNTSVDINGDGYVDGVLSTLADDSVNPLSYNYTFYQGTSMAAPHVAGVIALMESANHAQITPANVEAWLASGWLTDDIGAPGFDNSFGWGLINARKAVDTAITGTPPPPTLSVSPGALNFGTNYTLSTLSARNAGGGSLSINSVTESASWLDVTLPGTGDGLGNYTVQVDRSGLATGTYNANITFDSTENDILLPVTMQVGGPQADADLGHLYIQLRDSGTQALIDEIDMDATTGTYAYTFSNVPPGTYTINAGTDFDNDQTICDYGEACGAYRTLFNSEVITVSGANITGIDFAAGYDVPIQNFSTTGTQQEYSGLPRQSSE